MSWNVIRSLFWSFEAISEFGSSFFFVVEMSHSHAQVHVEMERYTFQKRATKQQNAVYER